MTTGHMPTSGLLDSFVKLYRQFDVVDLSPILENGIPRAPTHPPLVIAPTVTHEHDGYYCQTLFMPEHIGAHVDAPAHVVPNMMERTVDTYPPDMIVGPAVVLDMTRLGLKAGELLSAEDVLRWEEEHQMAIRPGDIALFDFGWMARYWKTDRTWNWYAKNSPGMDETVCRLLLERKVKAVGTDTFACEVGAVNGVETAAHGHMHYWLPNQIFEIECLANLERLPPCCFFFALPLKIKGGSGSPIRAMALVPRVNGGSV
jgi:kynurenine formamidase